MATTKSITKSILVLVTDRMNIGLWRPYGCSMAEQGGLDRLLMESVLFDQYYAASCDLSLLYESFWQGRSNDSSVTSDLGENLPGKSLPGESLPKRMASAGMKTVLLTDLPELAASPLAHDFQVVSLLPTPAITEAAESSEETHLYNCFETAAQIVHEEPDPLFLWCHFRGFAGPWDFPQTLRDEQRQDEEDPEPYAGLFPPFYPESTSSDVLPGRNNRRRHDFDSSEYADQVLAVTETMLAGMAVWDSSLEGFYDFLREENRLDNALLVVAGARGFPLGEHGRTGFPSPSDPNVRPALFYNEDFHMPLLCRFPQGRFPQDGDDQTEYAAVRTSGLAISSDLYPTLLDFVENNGFDNHVSDTDQASYPNSLMPLITEEAEQIHEHLFLKADTTPLSETAIVSSDSLLIQRPDGTSEFFILPDDRFNVNDVADRCREEVESLLKNKKF